MERAQVIDDETVGEEWVGSFQWDIQMLVKSGDIGMGFPFLSRVFQGIVLNFFENHLFLFPNFFPVFRLALFWTFLDLLGLFSLCLALFQLLNINNLVFYLFLAIFAPHVQYLPWRTDKLWNLDPVLIIVILNSLDVHYGANIYGKTVYIIKGLNDKILTLLSIIFWRVLIASSSTSEGLLTSLFSLSMIRGDEESISYQIF